MRVLLTLPLFVLTGCVGYMPLRYPMPPARTALIAPQNPFKLSDSEDGWNQIKWGATPTQLKSVYGSELKSGPRKVLSDHCLGYVGLFTMDDTMVPNVPAKVTFCFEKGRLAEVEVNSNMSEEAAKQLYAATLTKYGNTVDVENERLMSRSQWLYGSTRITYSRIGDPYSSGNSQDVSVSFYNSRVQPQIEFR